MNGYGGVNLVRGASYLSQSMHKPVVSGVHTQYLLILSQLRNSLEHGTDILAASAIPCPAMLQVPWVVSQVVAVTIPAQLPTIPCVLARLRRHIYVRVKRLFQMHCPWVISVVDNLHAFAPIDDIGFW
jgi:hypothetical protein